MKQILDPKSVAIIGATDKKGKIGNILLKNISQNKKIKLFPINPKHHEIAGLKAYPSVLDIEEEVDLAIIAIPAKFVVNAVQECAWKNGPIKNIVIISAGFSEESDEGAQREVELEKIAKENDLKIVGPNCLGIINTAVDFNGSFAGEKVSKGSVGLVMQSGALTTALFDMAADGDFGFSLVTTLGNKLIVNENDLLKYYMEDVNTKIIALYLEDIAEGKGFAKCIREASKQKPVVVLKAGVSKKAQAAIQSHTGAMAGDAAVTKEVIEENGGIYCKNLQEFAGIISLLDGYEVPKNNSVAIITNAGGPGVVTTDIIESDSALHLFEMKADLKERIKKELPRESSVENPIDVLGDAMEDRYDKVLNILKDEKELGAILIIVTPQAQTPIEAIAQLVADAKKKTDIPVIPIFIGGESARKAERELSKNALSNFRYPYNAVKALERAWSFGVLKERLLGEKKSSEESEGDKPKTHELIVGMKKDRRRVFYYDEATKLGAEFDMNILEATYLETNASEYKGKYPVVLKLDSPNVLHKNAKSALFLNIKDQSGLEEKRAELEKSFPGERMLVQPMIEPGFEVIIGIKENSSFGHVLMVGMGGIFTELFDTKLLWQLPVGEDAIRRKLESSKIGNILEKQKIDIEIVVKAAQKVARLSLSNVEVKELDINPIMLYKEKEPMIVDIKILL